MALYYLYNELESILYFSNSKKNENYNSWTITSNTSYADVITVIADNETLLPSDCSNMFKNCDKLNYFNFNYFDLSDINCANDMFNGCTSLERIFCTTDLTSRLNSANNMFLGCVKLPYYSDKKTDGGCACGVQSGGYFGKCAYKDIYYNNNAWQKCQAYIYLDGEWKPVKILDRMINNNGGEIIPKKFFLDKFVLPTNLTSLSFRVGKVE